MCHQRRAGGGLSSVLCHCVLHVSCVPKAAMSGLGRSLVVPHLQVNLTFRSSQLLLCECPLIFFSHFWSKPWSSVFWVFLSLKAWRDVKLFCYVVRHYLNNMKVWNEFNWLCSRLVVRLWNHNAASSFIQSFW